MEILEVQPLRMIPPEGFASNSGNVSDFDSSKVAASPSNCNSANWLPPGWTVENRTTSGGYPYKVYKDPDTGTKFYSRTKVLQYLQNQTSRTTPNKRMPDGTATVMVDLEPILFFVQHMVPKFQRMVPPEGFASNSGNVSGVDSSKVAASPSKSANWLPPGWIVENRIKSSGSQYKVYKNLDTGIKLYSRTKVLEYLQNPTPRRTPNRMQAETTLCNEHPNWLPPDWVVELKTKMSGETVGKKYKVYVEKSTGKKFYSIRQALDYLKPSNSSSPETKDAQSTGSEDHPDWSPQGWKTETESDDAAAERKFKVNHTEIEGTNLEGFPPGWFKAIRYRESRAGIRYKVAIYVDPISGYAFFSTKDAQRYIDNGHIKDCRMKPALWSKISNEIEGNKFHSQPTAQERELKPEGRKGKRPLFAEENYEEKSEEDIIDIDDSDEENGSTPKEMRVKRPLFSEEISKKKSEDETEPNDLPIGVEKAGTAEMEKEKMPEAPVPRRSRVKVCATKGSPSLCSSKSTSPKALPNNPSNVNPVQTNQKDNGQNPESEQKKDTPEQASSQQVDEVSPSSLLGEPSLDSCLEFAFKTLTEDILVLDKDEEV